MYSTPPSSQACCSSGSMGREASEIWVSPAQNASKPSPVPAPPSEICMSGFSWLNASDAAWVIGSTVLEPSVEILPETLPPPSPLALLPPHVARTSDNARRRTAAIGRLKRAILLNPYTPCFAALRYKTVRLSGHDDRARRPRRSFSSVNSALIFC